MAKKKNKMNWQRNIKIDENDNEFLNTKHWYEPEDFTFTMPEEFVNGLCNHLKSECVSDEVIASTKDYLAGIKLQYDLLKGICSLFNRLRIEYISLKWNGEPKKSYKPEVSEKINRNKQESLDKKIKKAHDVMVGLGLRLKPDFDPKDENHKPKD